jgi:hypothetical protein
MVGPVTNIFLLQETAGRDIASEVFISETPGWEERKLNWDTLVRGTQTRTNI